MGKRPDFCVGDTVFRVRGFKHIEAVEVVAHVKNGKYRFKTVDGVEFTDSPLHWHRTETYALQNAIERTCRFIGRDGLNVDNAFSLQWATREFVTRVCALIATELSEEKQA